ncbi:MAG TPA: FtsQ-type POTRA domain-containing protein [Pyrinomonadaceae bacterium]|nr:FtsQ-type POTRA domain-containing protein [Pyrinomonadaceae bacterium]
MRESVVGQKVGNRSGMGGRSRSSSGQRPARREREPSVPLAVRLRKLVGYIPIALKLVLAIVVAVLVFLGYRAAASASFFQIRNIETRGATRASVELIQNTVRHDVAATGVWRANLEEVSAHLERLPWVRTAVVSRVLPDGMRVRITEREPRAVVHTAAGHFVWTDEDAVTLDEMVPTDPMPSFFLRGWNEENSTAARDENRERVKKFLELQREWNQQGIAERVSEVNLLDLRDVRAQLAGDDSQIEVRLGSQEQAAKLKSALNTLDRLRQTPRGPYISYLDVNQGKRVIVGLVSGLHTVDDGSEPSRDVTSREDVDKGTPAIERNKDPKPTADKDKKKNTKDTRSRTQAKKPEQKRA